MTNLTNCLNCRAEFTSGLISSVKPLSSSKIKIINEFNEKEAPGYCSKCGKELYSLAKSRMDEEIKITTDKLLKMMPVIPIISTHSPYNWEYRVITLVTGQSTTGTGVISEFTSSITDLFGAQSGRYNSKLREGESICFAQLRKQTLDVGGNAIIATDIDYSELGSLKGMIMVCATGTAVKLNNTEVLGKNKAELLDKISDLNDRLKNLLSLKED